MISGSGSSFGSGWPWVVLEVAIKSDLSPLFPIRRIVGIDPQTRTQGTEEDVLRWIHHNSYVSPPNGQVSGLRVGHSLKFIDSGI
jgi:hypothetical protein